MEECHFCHALLNFVGFQRYSSFSRVCFICFYLVFFLLLPHPKQQYLSEEDVSPFTFIDSNDETRLVFIAFRMKVTHCILSRLGVVFFNYVDISTDFMANFRFRRIFFWAPLPDESNCDHRFYFRAPTFFPFGEKWTRGVSNEWPSSALRSVSLAHRSLSFHANPLVSLFFSSVLHVHLRCTEFITDFTGKPVIVLLFGNISIRGVFKRFFVFTFE